MAVRKKTHRKLCLESLERRTLLDGTVLATLDARTGILAITGDARDNGVSITTEEIEGAWHVKVAGTDSTWIATRTNPRGTKVNTAPWVSFPAANVKGMAIDMKDGRNTACIDVQAGPDGGNLVLDKDFTFKSGKNLDCLCARGFDVRGNLNVKTGAGGDTVELGAAIDGGDGIQFIPVNVAGTATIDLGAGNNTLQMRGMVDKDLAIAATTGTDAVLLAAGVGGNLSVNLGANQDTLLVSQFVEIPGPPTATRIAGNATVNMGDGNNSVQFNAQVGKDLTIIGGKHFDSFLVGIGVEAAGADPSSPALQEEESPPPIVIQGNLTVDSGAGNDTIYAVADVGGRTSVKSGAGTDDVVLLGTLQGNVAVDTGADTDWVEFYATAAADVNIQTGEGDDGVSLERPGIGGNLTIDTGADGDDVTLLANVQGNVSVKTGDGNDAVSIGGGDPNAPMTIQGSLLVDTGAGDDGVSMGQVIVGTASPAQRTKDAALTSGDVRIALGDGGELFANPNGESDVPYLATEYVRVWGLQASGKLTVDGGNGDNAIALLQCTAAHADVRNGTGDSLIAIGQLDLGGTGNLVVNNGPGDDGIFIGARFGWNEFFSVDGGGGGPGDGEEPFLANEAGWTAAFGVNAASVSIQTSSVYSGQVTIADSNIDKSLTINVKGGDVLIALCNVQGLATPGGSGRVGQVSIRTSAGNDQVNILPCNEGDFGLKADSLAIDTGAGNDAVAINAVTADQAMVALGAGDDFLTCGDLAAMANAVLDGGAGKQDKYEGPVPATWQFKNFEEMPAT